MCSEIQSKVNVVQNIQDNVVEHGERMLEPLSIFSLYLHISHFVMNTFHHVGKLAEQCYGHALFFPFKNCVPAFICSPSIPSTISYLGAKSTDI
jgi:hypothetical protein